MPKKFQNKEEERKYYRERKQIQKTKKSSECVTTPNEIQHEDFVITPKLEPPPMSDENQKIINDFCEKLNDVEVVTISDENQIINNFLENLSEVISQVELNEVELNEVQSESIESECIECLQLEMQTIESDEDICEMELQNFQPMIFNAIIQYFVIWQIKVNKVHKQMSLLKKISRLYV